MCRQLHVPQEEVRSWIPTQHRQGSFTGVPFYPRNPRSFFDATTFVGKLVYLFVLLGLWINVFRGTEMVRRAKWRIFFDFCSEVGCCNTFNGTFPHKQFPAQNFLFSFCG